ncbi:hypothetical protein F0562_003712 [Nyssa sinensis]|uniref:Uncharacterized protein n=1 Tax=Nyssa sinensis TaxID=561372 RepID=A0A5J5BXR5_9ASTE|nr:hypothetical protein F0562_003712 [Nyssa sinensis]
MADNGKNGDKSTSFLVLGDDPFSIHHSNNPTAVLVSPPLNGDNYGSWLRAITMAFLCYACNANIKHKFDQCAKLGIFIGYPYGHKGYRIYDIESHSIYTSRDVIFHEGIFPFRDVPQSSAPPSTVIPLPVHDNGNFDFSPHPSPPVPNGHVDTSIIQLQLTLMWLMMTLLLSQN